MVQIQTRYLVGADGSATPVLVMFCQAGCGTHVQETMAARFTQNFVETIICPGCGADNSTRPPLGFRMKYGLRLANKRIKAYGWRHFLLNRAWDCWQMPYEKHSKATHD